VARAADAWLFSDQKCPWQVRMQSCIGQLYSSAAHVLCYGILLLWVWAAVVEECTRVHEARLLHV
jgi:hypothetical protein